MKNQLSCQKCGGNCIATSNMFIGKSEFGFETREVIYKCEKCGAEHILCGACLGKGFEDKFNDCDECQGMGVIDIERLNYYV